MPSVVADLGEWAYQYHRISLSLPAFMEIHQLRYFCAVAQAGNFTRAAEQAGIAQPSLSQQIVRLEESVGSKLFDRLGRGVRLTEAGRALLPKALEILRHVHDARTAVESFQHGVAGRLIVGSIPTITPYFLAPRLSSFVATYPDVELRLVENLTANLVGMLQAGEMDLALISPPVTNPDIVCSDLFREPIFVAVAADHRLAKAETIQLPDLTGEKLLLLKEGHCFRDNALTVCNRSRMSVTPIFESDQFASILPLVSAGVGISLVPAMAAGPASGCKFRRLGKEAHRRIGYMRIRRHAPGRAQKAFIAWLREIAKNRAETA